jgi:hypothetical protein
MVDQTVQQEEAADDSAKPEKLLYHYTDQKGLDGILESGCMWATHYRFLNDSSERKIGFGIYSKAVEKVVNSKKNLFPEGPDKWNEVLSNYFDLTDAYTVSFSKDRDDENIGQAGDRLSQWRGYTSGTQGFCLGFINQSIAERASNLPGDLGLFGQLENCNYSEIDMASKIEIYTNELFKEMEQINDRYFASHPHEKNFQIIEHEGIKVSIRKYASNMLLQCSIYKHPGFEEENEARLIAIFVKGGSADSNLIEFRPGKLGQTPYIEIPLGIRQQKSSLKRIIIAPSPNMEQVVARLKIRLLQMGLPHVKVVASKIPYRN